MWKTSTGTGLVNRATGLFLAKSKQHNGSFHQYQSLPRVPTLKTPFYKLLWTKTETDHNRPKASKLDSLAVCMYWTVNAVSSSPINLTLPLAITVTLHKRSIVVSISAYHYFSVMTTQCRVKYRYVDVSISHDAEIALGFSLLKLPNFQRTATNIRSTAAWPCSISRYNLH